MDAPKSPTGASDSQLHFLDYWRIIRIRKTVIIAVFLLVVLTTMAVTFILPKSYMSVVRIAVDKDVSDIALLGSGFGQTSPAFDPYFIQTEFEKIKSKSVLHQVITNLNLMQKWGERYAEGTPLTLSEAYKILYAMVDLRQTRNTSLIEVRVYSDAKEKPAEEASLIANTIAETYRRSRLAVRREMAESGIETLQRELKIQEDKVRDYQAQMDTLKKELGISESVAEGVAITQMLEPETVRRLEAERITAQASYAGMSELLNQLNEIREKKGTNAFYRAIPNAYPDPELGKLLQDMWYADANFAKQSEVYGRDHPEMRRLAALQADLAVKVHDKIEGIMMGMEVRVASKQAELDTLARHVNEAKQNEAKMTEQYRPYFTLRRDLESVQKIRDAILLRTLQETVDAAIPKSSIVTITDAAEPDRKPVRPNIPLNIALGVVVGLVVGIGLAFFIEYLDTSVKTIDDVERALQSPVLGVIPQNVGSLMDEGPESPHAEAYRVLRTNILFSRKKEDATTITIVSGGAGEGKSTTIFNLCTVFAQNGQRVLLVDSDLRRPSLHKLFKVSNTLGLTNYLLGQNKLEEVVQTSTIPTLDFLPSGKLPSSSLGILNSPQMRDFIQEIRRRYDFVFFDSPPIMGVSDASVLTSMVDLTLLVIQYRKYPQAMTVRAKQMVEKIGGNLLGVVLNNINISQDSYYYYYSGYYYDYYSKRDDSGGETGKNGEKSKKRSSRGEAEVKQKY